MSGSKQPARRPQGRLHEELQTFLRIRKEIGSHAEDEDPQWC